MTAVWVAVLAVLIALAYTGMWKGWHNRAERQSDIPEPQWIEDGWSVAGASIPGTYVSTTTAGNWLDRITAHGLGSVSEVSVVASDRGLALVRAGAPSFWIPADTIIGVRSERGIAGKVREKGGLVVITWWLGSSELDTGIRPAHKADGERIEQFVAELMERAGHG